MRLRRAGRALRGPLNADVGRHWLTTLRASDFVNWQDNAKSQLGKNATFVWLIGGACLFLYDGGLRNLFSLRAAAFLGIGMFAAAIIVGGVSYLIVRAFANRLMKRFPDPSAPEALSALRAWRHVFGIVNLTLGVLFVIWVYASFFWL